MLKNANRFNNMSGRNTIHDNDDVFNSDSSTAGGARYINNNGHFHNDSHVDVLETDNNEPNSGDNSTRSIDLRQMHNHLNVQTHIRQPQKRHRNHEESASDDEREYFIALNSDALRTDIGERDEIVRKIRSDEDDNNPVNASETYAVGDEMCTDFNSSTCYHGDADNITCVGDPAYCNYTYEEYVQMLHDYITPTVPEWILICSHAIVFFIGLVSKPLSTRSITCQNVGVHSI